MGLKKHKGYKKVTYTPTNLEFVCKYCGEKTDNLISHILDNHKLEPEELERLKRVAEFYKGEI